MAKFYGAIGFAETVETSPGVWTEQITERNCYGDVLKSSRRLESGDEVNSNINISNTISIIADSITVNNIYSMRYLVWNNTKWKISNVEVNYPRLLLTIGGLYSDE